MQVGYPKEPESFGALGYNFVIGGLLEVKPPVLF